MVIVWALSWWYGAGWKARLAQLREQLLVSYDFFSIGLLVRTLFAPFRQISAGKVAGPLDVKVRAFFDRLISRVIGAFVRVVLIITGSIWLGLQVVFGGLVLIGWAFMPIVPLIGFIAMLSGWVPSWM